MAETPGTSSASADVVTTTVTQEVACVQSVFEDKHVKEIGLVKEILMDVAGTNEEDHGSLNIKLIKPAVEFSSCENEVRSPPPNLGQHTVEVLKNVLNYSDDQVATLLENGDVS